MPKAYELYDIWGMNDDINAILKKIYYPANAKISALDVDFLPCIEKAIACLNRGFDCKAASNHNGYALTMCGKQSSEEHKETEKQQRGNAVRTMISSRNSVGIMLEKHSGEINYILTGENLSKQCAESSLKSWLETVDIKDIAIANRSFSCSYSAQCIKIPKKEGEMTDKALSNWVTAVINANISSDYRISFCSEKVECDRLQEMIAQLVACHSELSRYHDITMNMSAGYNNSASERDAHIREIGKILKDGTNTSNSHTLNTSVSVVNKNAVIKTVLTLLEERISNLTNCLAQDRKVVCITCCCEDSGNAEILKAVISSALGAIGYGVTWKKNNGNIHSAIELNQKNISDFFYLPEKDFPGFERKEYKALGVNSADTQGDLALGNIFWNNGETANRFAIETKKLNRHAAVFGMTGSGKSNTVFSIIEKVNVPFMVIEPVKSEYKKLKGIYEDLVIHHTDAEREGVLRINPFWFPENASLSFHMDSLKKIISSAFSLYAAMPNILEQCIYNCYIKKGWNVVKSTNIYKNRVPDGYLYPTFSDLCDEIELYLNNSAFTGEALGQYQGALLSRLKSFTSGLKGVLLNTTAHPDYESWLSTRHIIELDGLADDADKSIVMGSLIMQYFQCVRGKQKVDNLLKHMVIIEEAHRLFKRSDTSNQNQEIAAPEAQLVSALSNMMAEIRAYGEGFLIVDQSPGKVAEDVVNNSSTKIIHRLDSKKDIEQIENSLLDEKLMTTISGLKQGEAIVRTEGMTRPVKIKVDKSEIKTSAQEFLPSKSNIDLDDASNVDFILSDEEFTEKLTALTEKFINHLLYDDLRRSKTAFSAYLSTLQSMLFMHGYSELADASSKNLYLLLVSEGIKKTIELQKIWQREFLMNFRMFSERLCRLLSQPEVTFREIQAFTAFRANILLPMVESKNMNGGTWEKSLAAAIGHYSIYADLLYGISNYISNEEIATENPDELTVEFFAEIIQQSYRELFIVLPNQHLINTLAHYLRSLYLSIVK